MLRHHSAFSTSEWRTPASAVTAQQPLTAPSRLAPRGGTRPAAPFWSLAFRGPARPAAMYDLSSVPTGGRLLCSCGEAEGL